MYPDLPRRFWLGRVTVIIILVLILIIAFLVFKIIEVSKAKTLPTYALELAGTKIELEVADAHDELQRGLSHREFLPENTCMLFVFPRMDYWAIWMKDMKFSLDIIWADELGRVVSVVESVSPDTYPETFTSKTPAAYVLECSAGFAAQYGVAEGSTLPIHKE